MSLSVCILTRDAEAGIGRAIRSLAPLGAEVIVGDTGSKDATVPTAEGLGARVLVIPWENDFAAAQNRVLAEATGDWVLWLNPDEELLDADRDKTAPLFTRADVLAYLVGVQEVMQPDHPERAMETRLPRLFRRRPDMRYVGRLHPHFDPPLDALARDAGLKIVASDLLIRHHAYQSVPTPDKVRWATRLLELELQDRPGQLHYLIEYGRNLLRLNDPRGHAVLADAADLVLAAGDATSPPSANAASLLEYLLTVAPEQSRSRLTAVQARELALRWFPASPPLLWVLAQKSFQAGDCADAARLLERLLDLGRTGAYDRSLAFDPSLVAEPALLNLGAAYLRLGELDRAEPCFGQLLTHPAHQAQARRGYEAVQEARRRRS
jgi:hypothetical protein